ncbi:MAG: GNAT family N-acetyltransferase [bacterium]|nr:GNAT family N-acetyltransferase [bacterium]
MASQIRLDSYRREIVEFLDCHFDGTPGVVDEFPTLMGPGGRSFVLRGEADQVIAHAAWRPCTLRCGEKRVRAAAIGLVTTSGTERQRGHASHLVNHCVRNASTTSAEVVFLFAPPRSLYTQLGFVPAGRERVIRLEGGQLNDDKRVRQGEPERAEELLRLLRAHPVGVERSVNEFQRLLAVRDTHLWVLENEEQIEAYCVVGKGRDLQGVIHEWAGEPASVETLLCAVAARTQEQVWVLSPVAEPAPVQGPTTLGPVAQFRILKPESLGSDDPRVLFGHAEDPAQLPLYVWGLDSV